MKNGVLALIKKGDRYLLGVEAKDCPYKGEWRLIGGRVEDNESFEDALKREVKEEIGIAIKVSRHLTTAKGRFGDVLLHVFLADYVKGTPTLNEDEISEIRFVTKEEMKQLNLELTTRQILKDCIGLESEP